MTTVQIIGTTPSAFVTAQQFYRAVWQGSLSSWVQDMPAIGQLLYDSLRAGQIDYATPINLPGVPPGGRVVTIDVQTFTPDTVTTVADFANALDGLRLSADLFSLELVQSSAAIGGGAATSRDHATQVATAAATSQSVLAQLGDEARYVLLAVVVLVGIMLVVAAHHVIREVS